jgi:hypothetical protein
MPSVDRTIISHLVSPRIQDRLWIQGHAIDTLLRNWEFLLMFTVHAPPAFPDGLTPHVNVINIAIF